MNDLKEIRECALVNAKEIVQHNEEKIKSAYQCVMQLEYIVRKEGLLALEYMAKSISHDTPLRDGVLEMTEMVVDGIEPKHLAELLTIKFVVNNYCGIDAILYFLYARSILMIQAIAPVWEINYLFRAVIPEKKMDFNIKYITDLECVFRN